MGASVKFSSRGQRQRASFSEINVTPMVDVMLVLLVIFMVTAPMMTTGVSLDLPRGDGQAMEDSDRAVDISVDMQKSNPDLKVVISGDRAASYGQVIEVMSLLRLAGIAKVGLKTGDTLGTDALDDKPAKKK